MHIAPGEVGRGKGREGDLRAQAGPELQGEGRDIWDLPASA